MTQEEFLLPSEGESKVDLFRNKEIRKTLHEGEWWFSVKDVLEALVDTVDGTKYAALLRKKDPELNTRYPEITRTLPFISPGGIQDTTFVNIEGIFRLMQSVPSAKAEPFKKWLAKVGFERLQEVQNPELAIKRAITLYRAKGYDDGWIDARIRNKVSREALTAEWNKRGVDGTYYGLLTDAISIKTFGIRTADYKTFKNLTQNQSLRDNMTPIELTLTTLGEQAATEITKATDARGYRENLKAAEEGGSIAGDARKKIEEATKQKVISSTNYLTVRQRENNAKELQPTFDQIMRKHLPLRKDTPQ